MNQSLNFNSKKILIFDKDDTITLTKSAINNDVAKVLISLSKRFNIAIISGSAWEIFLTQLTPLIDTDSKSFFYLPSSGSQFYLYKNDEYSQLYNFSFSEEEFNTISCHLLKAYELLPLNLKPEKVFSNQIDNRSGQITLSALGQEAPIILKRNWDPDHNKRNIMAKWLREKMPQYDIKVGGSTSIDVTKRGVNKEFAVRKLLEYLHIQPSEAVYFGDSLQPGGNDEVVKNIADLDTVYVKSERDTFTILNNI